ncbi:hypothetical protein LCGC14_1676190 [marine sediment metagenome]|uniref:Uncharacterized protein n=1 Tax=marine sediment metagenome TaxID=412755 RepID=A0A0F9K5M2_9ZZZZ
MKIETFWIAGMILLALGGIAIATGLPFWKCVVLFMAMAAVSSLVNFYWHVVLKK